MTQLYIYDPVAFDAFTDHSVTIPRGAVVRKVQPPGCPKNGTMGFTYIKTEDGKFVGLRRTASLRRK